ncbi:TLC domain-containing protein [Aspergillus sclerotioniger CBS 115572]|uniref:TLC domain-containing protein n=1 Tax=Aspergillus sclerotioniger CBS 115572 TaxID=1450535 RepID=A0A317V817_9EURO|nr:TLC domain-containing protein [Aspergillus sclerotioniger CBS 115572]PWY68962.1 TLC domain-containing protein [Aspergillus sclerotioniger CBS 115572]
MSDSKSNVEDVGETAQEPSIPSTSPAHNESRTKPPPYSQGTTDRTTTEASVSPMNTGVLKWYARGVVDNQIGIFLHLVSVLVLTHLYVPTARPFTSRLLLLSHYNPDTQLYGISTDDFYLVGFYVFFLSGLRVFLMEHVLAPVGRQLGLSNGRDLKRFSEQGWLLSYFFVSWILGMYIYCTSECFLNMRQMFTDWPTRELPAITKAYILGQWAFWQQQVIAIHLEERRRDHWQMLAHHVIANALIFTSYVLHLTRVANLILVLMDVVDIVFCLAKCLKYLGYSTLCNITFGVFMITWFVARHVFYLMTMWSIWIDMAEVIPVGCYHGSQRDLKGPTPLPQHGWMHILDPFLNPAGTICFSRAIQGWFLGSLGFLQILTMVWFIMIIKVAIRVVKGDGATDIRSVHESENEEEQEEEGWVTAVVEEGVDEIVGGGGSYRGWRGGERAGHGGI